MYLVKGGKSTYIGQRANLYRRLLTRVLYSISSAKASHAQLPDMSLRRDTHALRLIARIPLIQRREKCYSREEKSAFP